MEFKIDTDTLIIKERENLINYCNSNNTNKKVKLLWPIIPNTFTTILDDFAFRLVCQSGDLEVAKCLIQVWSPLDINYAFRVSCQWGQLHIAKWLYELYPNIDIHEYGDFAMFFATIFPLHVLLMKIQAVALSHECENTVIQRDEYGKTLAAEDGGRFA